MRVIQVEVIAGTVKICWHRGKISRPILAIIGPAHLYARNLCYGIGPVRRLQRTRQQILFLHGLWAGLRIDAARTKKQETLDARGVGGFNNVRLYAKILTNKVGGIGVVR